MSRWMPAPAPVMRPRAETRQTTVLQLLPLLPVAIAGVAFETIGIWDVRVLAVGAVITAIAQYVVARGDRALLDARGFGGLAPAALALVSSLLYLVLRARACAGLDRSAWDPVTWSAIITVVSLVGAALGTLLLGS